MINIGDNAVTISALIILHNDHDMLFDACRLVADIVDEFVIVDGAYEWTAPFLSALGYDPAVSSKVSNEAR